MLPAQLEPYLSSMNDLNLEAQLNDQTIIPSLISTGDGLTHCFQLGDSDVIYSMISHKINDHSKHQQHQPGEEGKEQTSSTQTKATNMSTSSTRKRQLSSNFNQLKQMIMTDDNMNSTEISSVYCWLENLISVNVCDLIVNAILQIGLNKSVVNSSATASMSKTSKALKSKSDSLKENTFTRDANKIDDDDDDSNDDDSVEDQLLLTKHGLKQLDVDLGKLKLLVVFISRAIRFRRRVLAGNGKSVDELSNLHRSRCLSCVLHIANHLLRRLTMLTNVRLS